MATRLELNSVDEDEKYYYYDHPVVGQFGILKSKVAEIGKNPAAINEELLNLYSEKLKSTDNTPSDWESFSTMFSREAGVVESATTRGVYELASGDRTTTYEEDFMDRLYLKTNPWTAYTGMLTGSIADVPSWFAGGPALKGGGLLLKLGKLGGVGAGLGFLQPVREEFGDSRMMNTAIAGAGTAALGGAVMAIPPVYKMLAKRLGFESPKAAQEAYDNASLAVQQEMEHSADKIAQELGLTEAQAEAKAIREEFDKNLERIQAENAPRNIADEQADIMQRLSERREADRIGAEYRANLERIQNDAAVSEAEKARLTAEFNENLARIQKEVAPEADFNAQLRANLETAYTQEQIADRVRAGLLNDLEKKMKSTLTFSTGRATQGMVKALRNQLRNVERSLARAQEGKKTEFTADQYRLRASKLREQIADKTVERDAIKAREQATRDYVKLKKGGTTSEYNARLRQALAEAPKLETKVPPKKVMDNIRSLTAEPTPPTQPATRLVPEMQRVEAPKPAPAQMTMPARPIPEAVSRFGDTQVKALPEGMIPFPSVRQQNPSVGAMGDNLGRDPSAIKQVLMMNTGSKAAKKLPDPRGTQADDLTEAKARRVAAMQKYEAESGIADRAFGFETQDGIFSDAAMEAEYQAALRAAQSAVRDGEASSIVEWIGRRAVEGNNIDLTTGEIQLLQRQAPIVMRAMEELQTKIRSTERIKTLDDVEAMYKAQALSRLYAAFDELRGIKQMQEGVKGRISGIMRSFHKTNQMALEEIRELRQGKKLNQIYLGLEC